MMTDEEKHAFCKERNCMGPVFVGPLLYAELERMGYDMRWYVIQRMMPIHGERLTIEHKLPTGEEMRAEMQRKLDAGELLGASHVAESLSVSAIGSFMKPDEYARPFTRGIDCTDPNCERAGLCTGNSPQCSFRVGVQEPRLAGQLNYAGAVTGRRFAPSDKARWADCGGFTRRGKPVRKHVGKPHGSKQCGGKEIACLPGKDGACVACCDED